ncbi:TPA: hypothetical protein ACGG79_003481 [Vibrio cholerae]|uniref:hypothetical protein n=1 Tax=Vibrio cholerae TaxID=666 RepID=UPI00293436C5|nr:hypothetical protein [Vibrio cholerae]EII2379429.1 hypothetical protein [Vibrio cholerae]EJL6916793.1 hypothetical protein [Vibrio cholerae]EJL8268550.1 hypothetical protein [Vibrio cholerae]EKF9749862.1 hypothetical protein [Vibrio cholerae]MDV2341058.1 hypothetical protein [Vibrio cholerae]
MSRKKTIIEEERRALKKRLAKKQSRKKRIRRITKQAVSQSKIVIFEVCAICGFREATTRDHVPPKAIFPKPRPAMITVPACSECNNGASDLDDLFKVYLSMQATGKSEIATKLFKERTVRTLQRNKGLLEKIKAESKTLLVENDEGKSEQKLAILWDSKAHDEVVQRTIRGLYYHHSNKPLAHDAKLKVQWLKSIPEEIESILELLTEHVIGDDQVRYKYYIAPEDPRHSVWLFDFYGAHYASGYTVPIDS